jgi:hypothetical protein
MSTIAISRRQRAYVVKIGTAAAQSTPIRFDDMAGAAVALANPSTAATVLRVYGSVDDDAYAAVFDSAGGQATIPITRLSGTAVETVGTTTQTITVFTAVNAVYALPDAAFPIPFVRLVSDHDLGTAAIVFVSTKS